MGVPDAILVTALLSFPDTGVNCCVNMPLERYILFLFVFVVTLTFFSIAVLVFLVLLDL